MPRKLNVIIEGLVPYPTPTTPYGEEEEDSTEGVQVSNEELVAVAKLVRKVQRGFENGNPGLRGH